MIRNLNIVVAQGVKTYEVGAIINGVQIHHIEFITLHFQGDPFDHYAGYSENGNMLFSVNCLVPCVIEYDHNRA